MYGYYKPQQRTLVMNISTGGGTLVHELTHALIDFDFPLVPDWFNEGLASLHEACHILPDESRIEGLTNWRLPGLQQAVAERRLPSLERSGESAGFPRRAGRVELCPGQVLLPVPATTATTAELLSSVPQCPPLRSDRRGGRAQNLWRSKLGRIGRRLSTLGNDARLATTLIAWILQDRGIAGLVPRPAPLATGRRGRLTRP